MSGANAAGANFTRAHLRIAQLPAEMAGANLCRATMPNGDASLEGCGTN